MRTPARTAVVMSVVSLVVLWGILSTVSADAKRYRVCVFPDRADNTPVIVDDFRVNETIYDEGGVQYLWVHGPSGAFQLGFDVIRQVEVIKWLGKDPSRDDFTRYSVKVTGTGEDQAFYGTMDVRNMRGLAGKTPWYYYPVTQRDRGSKFWRVTFGYTCGDPTIPLEAVKPDASVRINNLPLLGMVGGGFQPTYAYACDGVTSATSDTPGTCTVSGGVVNFVGLGTCTLVAHATVGPKCPSAIGSPQSFAIGSAKAPAEPEADELGDVFFAYDLWDLTAESRATLARNAVWMQRWPDARLRVEGQADPRGTNEYNFPLGLRRANAARDYLISLGISPDRLETTTMGKTNLVCTASNETCWQRNRRAHFVVISK